MSTRTDGDTTTQQIALPPDFAPGNTTIKFVDCPAVGSCVAAGDDNVHGLLLELANGTWTASEADLDQGKNVGQISGLSCAAPGECTATGSSASAGPVLLRLHDGSWTTTGVVPPHSHSGEAGLTGIDCASASYCLAAGYYGYGATHPGAFVVQIADGVQTVRRVPDSPRDGVATNIDAVQCPAVGQCTLIGEFGTRFPHKGSDFVSVRNGSAFVVTPIPLPAGPAPGSTLGSSYGPRATMSCPAVSLCYAAGAYNEHLPAVVRLKGTTVHFYALPRPAGEPNAIVSVDDIDCASRDACTAVGTGDFRSFNSSSEGAYYTFADGVWTTEVSQKAPGQKARPTLTDYTAVDCPAAGACIADGNYAWDLKRDDDDDGELLYMKASGLVSTETPN
ncbi:MAG: hypothetical protein INR67_18715 [Jatrophihabitans endophyticus]|nr:hypothetical protein [Jatrophihabitans endophyticus]